MRFAHLALVAAASLTSCLASSALAEIQLAATYTLGGSQLGVGFNPATDEVFTYASFASTIQRHSRSGELLGSLPLSGAPSNDIDLEFTAAPLNLGGTSLPANTLLVINGETTQEARALDAAGNLLAGPVTLAGSGQIVGGAHSPARDSLFTLRWNTDTIIEQSPATGQLLNSFSILPYDIFFGDMDILLASGNIYLVSSFRNFIREMTPTGQVVRDIDLAAFNIPTVAGIAFDDARGEAWLTSSNGNLYRLTGFDAIPAPGALALLGLSGLAATRRRR